MRRRSTYIRPVRHIYLAVTALAAGAVAAAAALDFVIVAALS